MELDRRCTVFDSAADVGTDLTQYMQPDGAGEFPAGSGREHAESLEPVSGIDSILLSFRKIDF